MTKSRDAAAKARRSAVIMAFMVAASLLLGAAAAWIAAPALTIAGLWDRWRDKATGWEGSPFKMMSAHCAGSFANIGDQVDEHGAGEFVNAAGDKFFGLYARKGDAAKAEGTWHVVHGTGKFEGMTMEGKFMSIGPFPPSGAPSMITACNHEWGTYSIK
jgi:hypothetical protein